jgi:membrane associated rhomboid family serine protease
MLHIPPGQAPPRQPIFNVPLTIIVACGALVALHALRAMLSDESDFALLLELAFIPAQWTVAWEPAKASEILLGIAQAEAEADGAFRLALARYVLAHGEARYWSPLSYALLHGSWTHVLLNSVWLAAFGTPVARRCGAVRFWALAVAAALGGAAAHYAVHSSSVMPMIGASAAVSGMMAAAARFVFVPDRQALGPRRFPTGEFRQPRLSLAALATNSQAALFVGIWFATNLLFGLLATPLGIVDASIAWEAHIGGFLVGLLLFPIVDPLQPMARRTT